MAHMTVDSQVRPAFLQNSSVTFPLITGILTFGLKMRIHDFAIYEEKNWVKAEQDGIGGFVPKNYISLKKVDWFFHGITREQAIEKLKDSPDDTFLVYELINIPGEFHVAVKYGEVQIFKVLRDSIGKYFFQSHARHLFKKDLPPIVAQAI
ncbi:hypothetical protein RRG08_037091 [Elysia crispata]|uniref:SH2 domain-containing protein n=1 Tax=Elysia crispata TaxID=231223 RepID=A0AAE0ZW02_9GAST|nr:hypothetical protein RRG08_037091 [Elysia crispata]